MNVSKPQVEQILKTLPIGYYIKRDVKVKLIDEDGSFYDLMNDEISISYPMIERVCKSLPVDGIVENDIRCLLYHEVSHAFLTPKYLNITRIMNVFEDERIESILRNFYLNVDFRNFVKRVNNFNGEKPKTADELYYQIVRYRIGPEKFVNRVHDIIVSHLRLENTYETSDYEYDVNRLYRDIVEYFNFNQQSQSSQSTQTSQSSSSTTQQVSTENSTSEMNANELSQNGQAKSQNDVADVYEKIDPENISSEIATSMILDNIAKYDDNDLKLELERILSSIKSTKKNNGSAINAYSGVFNPRSVARNDYKYFVQQNRAGHVKAYSKLHLNLFIDCSGSFRRNDKTVNALLKALIAFEKSNSDFSFTLISCSNGQKIRDKFDRVQHSSGGTGIDYEIFEQYKQVQLQSAQNINIVLYDGDACESYGSRHKQHYGKCFSAFDNTNSVVIVDTSNEQYMHNCTKAKVILTQEYVRELKKNVLDALRILCK